METDRLLLFVATLLSVCVAQDDPLNPVGYDEKYVEGVNAYTAKKWRKCIPYFKQSVERFSQLEDARQTCYSRCSQQRSKVTPDISGEAELLFFHTILQRSHCVHRCLKEGVGPLPRGGVPHDIIENLKKWEGLNFLQETYHKLREPVPAARACTQYLYFNPHDEYARSNLQYYQHYVDVTEDDLRPQTTFKYRDLYSEGHRLYYAEDWGEMVELFERALPELYSALDQCRRMCEGPLWYTGNLGLYQAVTTVHSSLVGCQAKCSQRLGSFRSDRSEDLFGSIFHYLQYGYYYLNRSKDALVAAATQVRLDPGNEEVKRSAVFFKQRPGVTTRDFKPREDVIPEILKQEAVLKYRKLLRQLSGDLRPASHEGEGDVVVNEGNDWNLLEEDFKKWPVLLEHSTSRTAAS